MTRARTTAETLSAILESHALDLHVALPGTVRSYDASAQTAEIELGVQRVLPAENEEDESDTPESLPILQSVPVAWPRGGSCFMHWPLAAGDTGLVVFCESDLNAWRESGGVVDPGVALRHGLSGAVFHPGLHVRGAPNASASGTYGRVGREGGPFVEFRETEIRVGGAQALAQSVQLGTHLAAIQADLQAILAAWGAAAPVLTYNYSLLNLADPIATSITKGD